MEIALRYQALLSNPTHIYNHVIDRGFQPGDDIHEKSTITDILRKKNYFIKSNFIASVSKSTTWRTVLSIANIDRQSFIAKHSTMSVFSSVGNENQFCDILRSMHIERWSRIGQ